MTSKTYTMPQFAKALKKMSANVRGQSLVKAAMAGGYVVEANAKINVMNTFKNVTGNLANTIQTVLESSSADEAVVAVGPTAIYGRIQELGGTVKPIFKKRLHWVDESGGHHTALEVTLPARPYLAPALEDHEDKVLEAMATTLGKIIEGSI
jgi:HK97 gp10 family phage protein